MIRGKKVVVGLYCSFVIIFVSCPDTNDFPLLADSDICFGLKTENKQKPKENKKIPLKTPPARKKNLLFQQIATSQKFSICHYPTVVIMCTRMAYTSVIEYP